MLNFILLKEFKKQEELLQDDKRFKEFSIEELEYKYCNIYCFKTTDKEQIMIEYKDLNKLGKVVNLEYFIDNILIELNKDRYEYFYIKINKGKITEGIIHEIKNYLNVYETDIFDTNDFYELLKDIKDIVICELIDDYISNVFSDLEEVVDKGLGIDWIRYEKQLSKLKKKCTHSLYKYSS